MGIKLGFIRTGIMWKPMALNLPKANDKFICGDALSQTAVRHGH